MESNRQKKFAREIQRELSQVLHEEVEVPAKILISLNHVSVSPDLQQVKAYITCIPETKLKEVLVFLKEENKKIRFVLANRIKNLVRSMPTLVFFEDDTMQRARELDELFEEIHKQDSEKNNKNDSST